MAKKPVIPSDNALRANIMKFMDRHELKPTPWAVKANVPESTLRSFLNGQARAPRHDTLEKLAGAAGVSIAEMIGEPAPIQQRRQSDGASAPPPVIIDRKITTSEINIPAMPRDVRILGGGACGEDGLFEMNGQVLGFAKRPPLLDGAKDIYALYVHGDSMTPWRENGGLVYVHPHMPVRINDFVVVQMHPVAPDNLPAAYIKRLVRRTADHIILHQYNPHEDLRISAKKVKAIHRIVDWDDLLGF